MASKKAKDKDEDKLTRIAIVNVDKCRPRKCRQECKKSCPVVRTGKACIAVGPESKIAVISEELCIGCGICPKKCPFSAINIINLPKSLERFTTHRYGPNSFKLHRLPVPRPGQVLGLVGTNGIGKSTALQILAGKLKPNLGKFTEPPEWQKIVEYFRGSELQGYFNRMLEDKLRVSIKMQYVDNFPKSFATETTVAEVLQRNDERKMAAQYIQQLDLGKVLDRKIAELSGGELQRFVIALTCVKDADVYMFDEPSSYLDVKQRLQAAEVIRGLIAPDKYVIVVEHDLSVLDFLSDFVCVLYGEPGAYGVVTTPFGVREGINVFLDGFVPTENLRFRDDPLQFRLSETAAAGTGDEQEEPAPAPATEKASTKAMVRGGKQRLLQYKYPKMQVTLGKFTLHVEAGGFAESEIVVLLGENGTGKTTFIQMLAGFRKPDPDEDGVVASVPQLNVSYKPQKINPKYQGTVRQLLLQKIASSFTHPQFTADVVRPMRVDHILDNNVTELSGGELQRVAIILALGQPADIYLIDEPSAYLDSEQRVIAAKVIKRFILHAKKTAFVVEHDFIMATYLADRVVVYSGAPAVDCTASSPQPLVVGTNSFLKFLDITFRRDPTNFRPRINKRNSVKDREQKEAGTYFLVEATQNTDA